MDYLSAIALNKGKKRHRRSGPSVSANRRAIFAYRLLRSWDSRLPQKVDSLYQARRHMTEINRLKVMPLSELEKRRTY